MRTRIRDAVLVVLLVVWLILSMTKWPPKKWEDLTPEELLRHDIDATAIW